MARTSRPTTPTSRSSARDASRAAERFFDLSRELFCVLDVRGAVVRANPAFERSTGWTAELLGGEPFETLVHPDDRERAIAGWARTVSGAEVEEIETRLRCRDGSYRWLTWRAVPPDEKGLIHAIARDAAARRDADARLRFQAQLLDAVGQSVIATTLDGTITYWGQGAEALFGWREDEVLGRDITQVTPTDSSREQAEAIMAALGRGQSWSGQFRLQRRDGSSFSGLVTDSPVRDEAGRLIGVVGITTDLTAQKAVEEALRWSEARYEGVMANVPGVVYQIVMYPDGVLEYTVVSDAVRDIFGVEPERVRRDPGALDATVHPDDRASFDQSRAEAAANLTRWRWEGRILNPERGERWVDAISRPARQADGVVVWDSLVLDVTERRRAAERLRDSEALLRSAFEHAPIGMALTTPDGRWVRVNPALCAMVGYAEEELLATSFQALTHPEDMAESLEPRRQLLAGERADYQIEKRYIHRDGHSVWLALSCVLVRDEHGQPRYVLGQMQDVTDRKRGEEALRASEARHRSLVETTYEGVWLVDAVGITTYVNARLCEMLGYTAEELVGRLCFDFMPPASAFEGRTVFARRQRGIRESYELTFRRRDGSELVASTAMSSLVDEDGEFAGALAMVSDITERRRAEDALRRRERLLRDGERLAGFGSWARDAEHDIELWSDELLRIFGVDERTRPATFEAFLSFVHGDDRERMRHRVQRALATGTPYEIRYRIVRPDGELRVLRERAFVEKPASGAVRLVGVAQDVTERDASERALQESEERFRAIADAAPVFIWTIDTRGDVDFLNRAWLDFRGRPLGREARMGWSEGIHPDDQERVLDEYRHGFLQRVPIQVEYRIRRHDDEYRWLLGRNVPRHAADGTFLGFIGSGFDITERRRAEEALQRLNEELEERIDERTAQLAASNRELAQATRHKSEFLASMSHELRTPLNGIMGFAELIHRGTAGPVTAQQTEYLEDVMGSAAHVLRLIDDVLDLATIEAGKIRLAPEPVNVAELLESVRHAVRPIADAQGVLIVTSADASLADVVVDPKRLKQVLLNYVSNALKHTPRGGRVEIRARPEGVERFRVEVEDTGRGIAAEDMSRLFQDFEQIRTAGAWAPAGAGLGLAVTRRLVEAQGGAVGARSELGRGSVFHAVLPRRPIDASTDAS